MTVPTTPLGSPSMWPNPPVFLESSSLGSSSFQLIGKDDQHTPSVDVEKFKAKNILQNLHARVDSEIKSATYVSEYVDSSKASCTSIKSKAVCAHGKVTSKSSVTESDVSETPLDPLPLRSNSCTQGAKGRSQQPETVASAAGTPGPTSSTTRSPKTKIRHKQSVPRRARNSVNTRVRPNGAVSKLRNGAPSRLTAGPIGHVRRSLSTYHAGYESLDDLGARHTRHISLFSYAFARYVLCDGEQKRGITGTKLRFLPRRSRANRSALGRRASVDGVQKKRGFLGRMKGWFAKKV